MSYPIQCPHCGAILNAEVAWAGKQSSCPTCHQTLTIPPPPAGNAEGAPILTNYCAGSGAQPQASYAQDYSGLAVGAFFVTLFCCGIAGLVMAIVASEKMKACGNMHGHGWVVATYIAFAISVVFCVLFAEYFHA